MASDANTFKYKLLYIYIYIPKSFLKIISLYEVKQRFHPSEDITLQFKLTVVVAYHLLYKRCSPWQPRATSKNTFVLSHATPLTHSKRALTSITLMMLFIRNGSEKT